jgi:hypothetical protein
MRCARAFIDEAAYRCEKNSLRMVAARGRRAWLSADTALGDYHAIKQSDCASTNNSNPPSPPEVHPDRLERWFSERSNAWKEKNIHGKPGTFV